MHNHKHQWMYFIIHKLVIKLPGSYSWGPKFTANDIVQLEFDMNHLIVTNQTT
jgi:hypothetical protein